tara:strand:- start:320 stop:673 length:354 start_codon:yes stop_codon:yes gene_type:complete
MVKKEIKQIQKNCLKGRLGVEDAIREIDRIIGGITAVSYNEDKGKFRITNHRASYGLQTGGLKKKLQHTVRGMAVGAYFMAQENGSMFPGDVNIDNRASTKHHMDGIDAYRQKYWSE